MKLVKTTLLSALLIVLTGCEVDYEEQPNESISKSVVGEQVEVVPAMNDQDNIAVVSAEEPQNEEDNVAFSEFEKAKVVYIVDGDTVDIQLEDSSGGSGSADKTRIRLLLINAPESKGDYENNPEAYALAASNFTKMLLLNNNVWVEYDVEKTDRYGRTLAYLWLDEVNYEYKGIQYHEKEVM
ncbi:MAG: thermonuclease family protein, partial [Kurthia sp.]|nr:thermonuclease family protein [Candidatus Kurthia equi]